MSKIAQQKASALKIVRKLQQEGYIALFAGGCVRDNLLGREPKDYDVATDAYPEEVEALFTKTIPIGKAFGVVAVVDGKEMIEVATFREEVGTLDGRHPETILFSAAKEDALRRDFSINGMFYDPVKEELYDYVHGQRDLKKRIITAIGDPAERFREDHLRMLRAVRFTHNLGFALDPATEAAIRSMAHLIEKISAERIEAELTRILTDSEKPGDALRHLLELGLLNYILPELLPMVGQQQPPQFHPEGDVFEHTCLMLNLMAQKDPVGQASLPAHPEDELASNPFRPIEHSESLHATHRRLPHWEQDSRIYFSTFRLADSMAQEKRQQWKEELDIWRKNQPDPDSKETRNKQMRHYRRKQQDWLDQGHGSCILKSPDISEIVEQTLLHFDGERYHLGDYVIMPNHVHLEVAPLPGFHLPDIMHTWKSYSAQKINKLLGQKGTLWMDESFDHIIRNSRYLEQFSAYILKNPEKAFLQSATYRLGKGSLELHAPDEQARMPAPHTLHVGKASLPAHSEVKPAYSPRELAYTVLLHDVGKPPTAKIGPGTDGKDRIRFDGHAQVGARMAEEILIRLKFTNIEKKSITTAIGGHMRFMDVQNMRTSKLRQLIGAATFDLEMELHRLDCLGSHSLLDNFDYIRDYQQEMADEPILPDPLIRGNDLIAIGICEGRLIGTILKAAYEAQMEDRFSSKEAALEWVRASYQSEESGNLRSET